MRERDREEGVRGRGMKGKEREEEKMEVGG